MPARDLPQGQGPLFVPPEPDQMRQFFRGKDRSLSDKRANVRDAVRVLVSDGDYIAPGGFGGDRIATALLHEIVRQKKQNLGLAGHTATHDFQILAAGNQTGRGQLLNRVDSAYIVGLEARGLSAHARRVMEAGEVEVCEWSNYALALRFKAGAMGVPFLPIRSLAGSDTFRQSAARTILCPYTQKPIPVVPALSPDVALIHVHEADALGNCRIRGTSVADVDLARAAKRVIISCERIVSTESIREHPTATVIPYFCVDAVCEVPLGSYPGNMPYEYFSDEVHLAEWLAVEKDPDDYLQFVSHLLFETEEFEQYLRRSGAVERLDQLRQMEANPGGRS